MGGVGLVTFLVFLPFFAVVVVAVVVVGVLVVVSVVVVAGSVVSVLVVGLVVASVEAAAIGTEEEEQEEGEEEEAPVEEAVIVVAGTTRGSLGAVAESLFVVVTSEAMSAGAGVATEEGEEEEVEGEEEEEEEEEGVEGESAKPGLTWLREPNNELKSFILAALSEGFALSWFIIRNSCLSLSSSCGFGFGPALALGLLCATTGSVEPPPFSFLWHCEHIFPVAGEPKKPQPAKHKEGPEDTASLATSEEETNGTTLS